MLPRRYHSGCNFTALLWRIKQESGVREICTLRLTWRGRETSYDSIIGGTPRGNREQRKEDVRVWCPFLDPADWTNPLGYANFPNANDALSGAATSRTGERLTKVGNPAHRARLRHAPFFARPVAAAGPAECRSRTPFAQRHPRCCLGKDCRLPSLPRKLRSL